MPNSGQTRKTVDAHVEGHEVSVDVSLGENGRAIVDCVWIDGINRWVAPVDATFNSLDLAVRGGLFICREEDSRVIVEALGGYTLVAGAAQDSRGHYWEGSICVFGNGIRVVHRLDAIWFNTEEAAVSYARLKIRQVSMLTPTGGLVFEVVSPGGRAVLPVVSST